MRYSRYFFYNKVTLIFISSWFGMIACTSNSDAPKTESIGETIVCSDPRPQICTNEYMPVCASVQNASSKTYPSGCTACSDKNVISYQADECKKDK